MTSGPIYKRLSSALHVAEPCPDQLRRKPGLPSNFKSGHFENVVQILFYRALHLPEVRRLLGEIFLHLRLQGFGTWAMRRCRFQEAHQFCVRCYSDIIAIAVSLCQMVANRSNRWKKESTSLIFKGLAIHVSKRYCTESYEIKDDKITAEPVIGKSYHKFLPAKS